MHDAKSLMCKLNIRRDAQIWKKCGSAVRQKDTNTEQDLTEQDLTEQDFFPNSTDVLLGSWQWSCGLVCLHFKLKKLGQFGG